MTADMNSFDIVFKYSSGFFECKMSVQLGAGYRESL